MRPRPSLASLFFTYVPHDPLFLSRFDSHDNWLTFCLQNKDKPKKGQLPEDMVKNRYLAAVTCGDEWINYPWEAIDIDEHDRLAAEKKL